ARLQEGFMSSIGCVCGHTIKDQTDNLPYKAQFLPDQNQDRLWKNIIDELTDLAELTLKGRQNEWLERHDAMRYAKDLSLRDNIVDFISGRFSSMTGDLFQCEKCGRLFVFRDRSKPALRFIPEDGREGALRKIEERHS